MPRVAGDATRHESVPLVACPSLPPPLSTQRLHCTSFARHCVPPHPCRRHLRALVTLELEWPCATRPHQPPLGRSEHGVYQRTAGRVPQASRNRATRMRRLEIRMVPIRIHYITGCSIGHPDLPANRQKKESRRADLRTAYPCSSYE